MTPDPLGLPAQAGGDITNPQSLNRYAYVLNNPETLVDPTGLILKLPCMPNIPGRSGGGCSWGAGLDSGGGFGAIYGVYTTVDGFPAGGFTPTLGNSCIGDCWTAMTGSNGETYEAEQTAGAPDVYAPNGDLVYQVADTVAELGLQQAFAEDISGQYSRLSGNLATLFGSAVSADPSHPTITGAHANFKLACTGPCPHVGRYPLGVHFECATGGYNCAAGSRLVAHDDWVSPWIIPFSIWAFNPLDFLEHGVFDLIGGHVWDYVFPR